MDPCKQTLINKCSSKCEDTFHKCKAACENSLTMRISADFERFQRMITSMAVSNLDATCAGNGITSALSFQANASIHISNAALNLKVHTLDAGIATSNVVDLQKVAFTLAVLPLSGSMDCFVGNNITMNVGKVEIADLDLDVNLQLDSTLATIAAVVCADLPFCKAAIKNKISSVIKDEIIKAVPTQVAKQLQAIFPKLASALQCPSFGVTKAGAILV